MAAEAQFIDFLVWWSSYRLEFLLFSLLPWFAAQPISKALRLILTFLSLFNIVISLKHSVKWEAAQLPVYEPLGVYVWNSGRYITHPQLRYTRPSISPKDCKFFSLSWQMGTWIFYWLWGLNAITVKYHFAFSVLRFIKDRWGLDIYKKDLYTLPITEFELRWVISGPCSSQTQCLYSALIIIIESNNSLTLLIHY